MHNRKFNQSNIQEIVKALDDACPELLDVKINDYCVWPAVKVVLWRYLTRQLVSEESFDAKASVIQKRLIDRNTAYFRVIIRTVFLFVLGFIPNTIKILIASNRNIDAIFIHPNRDIYSAKLGSEKQFFGNSIFSKNQYFISLQPAFFDFSFSETFNAKCLNESSTKFLVLISNIISKLSNTSSKKTAVAAQKIHSILKSHGGLCSSLPHALIENAIINFLNTYKIHKIIFSWTNPKSLCVIDFDSRLGEVAAAKALNITVYDLQHGTFWSNDLDHSWSKQARNYKHALPIPDFLLLRGRLWKEIALEKKFWRDEELICIGCAGLSEYLKYRKLPKEVQLANKKLNMCFFSGDLKPNEWNLFWKNFIDVFGENLHLRIKLHPREVMSNHPYTELTDSYRHCISVIPPTASVYDAILDSDIVIGSTSTTMIEAISLGTPTFSVSVGATPEGFAVAHGNSSLLNKILPHAENADHLNALINNFQKSPQLLLDWMEEVEKNLDKIYSKNFDKKIEKTLRGN
jgi:hypothetical protein